MFRNKKCILCASHNIKPFFDLKDSPQSISGLLKKENLSKDKKINIQLHQCQDCKLVQLPQNVLAKQPDFYEDYLMTVTHSDYMIEHQNQQARYFLEKFNLKGKNILEIGCGDGNFCSVLKKYGAIPTGVEPSDTFYQEAKKMFPDIDFIKDYLTTDINLENNKYEAFVSRQVFEHLANPNEVLQAVKRFLKPDGAGMIEVPSFEFSRKNNRFYDIFTDHVAYYTKHTLQRLLTQNAYEVLEIRDEADGEYLVAYFQNVDYHNDLNSEFKDKYFSTKKQASDFFKQHQDKKIGIWGAGGKGVAFLSQCGLEAVESITLFDSDEHKQGKYTPGSHFLITKPEQEKIKQCDVMVITAMMYYKPIIKKLINNYNYSGQIAVVAPSIRILDQKVIEEIVK